MSKLRLALLFLGLLLFLYLILSQDTQQLLSAIQQAGWGIVMIGLFHLLPLLINTHAWKLLLSRQHSSWKNMFNYRWICESSNNLLPVAQVGGEIIRARLLARDTAGTLAAASVLVDFTLGLIAQLLFALLGVALLVQFELASHVATQLLIWLLIAALPFLGFYYVQKQGLFSLLVKIIRRLSRSDKWHHLLHNAAEIDASVKTLYQKRTTIFIALCWRLSAWLLGVGETWLAFYFIGYSITLLDAVIIESLAYAARSMGFLIPGALGLVEGAMLLMGQVMGIAAVQMLSVALIKRAREVLLGIPGLLSWYRLEAAGPVK